VEVNRVMKVREITESVYPGNLGIMELMKFYKVATDSEKKLFDKLMSSADINNAWQLIQDVTGVQLQGDHFGSVLEKLKKVKGKWALVSKTNPDKVLQYYRGPADKTPSAEWQNKVERRVHAFEDKMKFPHNSDIDIPRDQMPQINFGHLEGKYRIAKGRIALNKIKPSQSQRVPGLIQNVINDIRSGKMKQKPLIIDKQGYLVNGHHRLDALKHMGAERVDVLMIDATLRELIDDFRHTASNAFAEDDTNIDENFADGKVKGKSRPGRVKRAGASCAGSVTDLRAKAKKSSGEKAKMYHWCSNMKSGRNKS